MLKQAVVPVLIWRKAASSISFFRSTQGAALTATAVCDNPGRHLGFYTVTVEDDLGKQIAKMTATCYR